MAKKPSRLSDSPKLFEQQERAFTRRLRRQRALFIPHLLREAADAQHLKDKAQDAAYAVALRWAELESTGHLGRHKETSIDTQFLDQLFGDALGYAVKTKSPGAWQLEEKFTVPGMGIADAALGNFPSAPAPTVVIELKDASTDLDRDKSNGRTAVQQCWDYLSVLPDCPWGIVSNFSTIRLYHRSKGALAYEEFTLQELRDRARFNEFYCLFERSGLLASTAAKVSRAAQLLERTQKRQQEVGDKLYEEYQRRRLELIEHLHTEEAKPLDDAIRIAQKILDRIIFIAFCEDRELLPPNSLEDTKNDVRRYSRAKNPAWENFLDLFRAIDKGAKGKREITAFNGGLFADDAEINALDLEEEKWTNAFAGFGRYDFSEEVNVEVLGHLFERSITELEKLRVGGLFALKSAVLAEAATPAKPAKSRAPDDDSPLSKMPKSAQRKRFGIYYTPPAFTGLIVERTIDALLKDRFSALAAKHKVDPESRANQDPARLLKYWQACLECLKAFTVCDPACGSGAFLIRAYDALDAQYKAVVHALAGAGLPADQVALAEDAIPDLILSNNLYGVDLSREGVEITQLALWIRSARKGKTLADLSRHIIHGNSLVSDKAVDPHALDWAATFPHIFAVPPATVPPTAAAAVGAPSKRSKVKPTPPTTGGFDCVIGNPPWEQMMLHDREFFGLADPDIATCANAAEREKLIATLVSKNPDLHAAYQRADQAAKRMLAYARESGQFPLTGRGRTNLYMCFAERAKSLVSPNGRVGLLLPSGIATDHTTKDFFGELVSAQRLVAVYDFVNRLGLFPDVEGRLKFCVLLFNGQSAPTESMDFVFWAERVEEIDAKAKHVALSARDIKLLNPNTQTCPIFRSQRDADLTKSIYRRVPILIDLGRKSGGNPWGVRFLQGLFNQTSDAALFHEGPALQRQGYKLVGNVYVKNKSRALPLLEAKMTRDYDHRATWVTMNRSNAYMNYTAESVSLVDHQNPEFLPMPRYWVSEEEVLKQAPKSLSIGAIGFHDIARANDTRTMVACLAPFYAYSNKLPLIVNQAAVAWRRFCCLAGNVNAYAYDFVVRQKVGGANLNFFIVEQIPTLPPDTYEAKCPWSKKETLESWISQRVLKLSCTAEDMIPLAKACDFKGSRGDGVHVWKEAERAQLRAELDAAFFHLYAVERDDAEYILSTFTNTGYVAPKDQRKGEPVWEPGSIGEAVLTAYDQLAAS